jgi:Multiubiquitin
MSKHTAEEVNMSTIEVETKSKKPKVRIAITVNRKMVILDEKRPTGLEIKQAAITQGVNIHIDFQLVKKNGRQSIPVDDAERVRIEEGDKFRANDGEDNS